MKEVDNILAHYGVKGMRWGRRSTEAPAASEDHTRTAETKTLVKSGGLKSASNKQLQDAINRMNLEQQYNRLNPSPGKKVAKFVADILLGVGKQEAIKFVGGLAADQIKKIKKD